MADRDLQYGQATIRRILRELEEPVELEHQYARAILVEAVRLAARRPTPQAPMAARNMTVDPGDSDIYPRSSGPAADVAFGAEFGSNRYAQFQHAVAPRGLWLYPAAESTEALAAGDRALEEVLEQVVAGG